MLFKFWAGVKGSSVQFSFVNLINLSLVYPCGLYSQIFYWPKTLLLGVPRPCAVQRIRGFPGPHLDGESAAGGPQAGRVAPLTVL